jgi:HEAT repeat protein
VDPEAYVAEQLALFRAGQRERAFFALLVTIPDLLPTLTQVFGDAEEPDLRAFLVKVLWQYREPIVLPVLKEALGDRNADVWEEALNGLVTLASPESLSILNHALQEPVRGRGEHAKFGFWLIRAIEETRQAIRQDQRAV